MTPQWWLVNVNKPSLHTLPVSSTGGPEELDHHPERRMKAAYAAFEEANLPRLKQENPNMRLSQLKQQLKKEWMKSPENPLNQRFSAYNSKWISFLRHLNSTWELSAYQHRRLSFRKTTNNLILKWMMLMAVSPVSAQKESLSIQRTQLGCSIY